MALHRKTHNSGRYSYRLGYKYLRCCIDRQTRINVKTQRTISPLISSEHTKMDDGGEAFGPICWSNLEYIWGVGCHTAVELCLYTPVFNWAETFSRRRIVVKYIDNNFKHFNFV